MLLELPGNGFIKLGHVALQGADQVDQCLRLHSSHRVHGLIGGQKAGFGDQIQALLDDLRAANIMGVVEGAHGGRAGFLEGEEVWPFGQEIQRQGRGQLFAQQEKSLGIGLLETGNESVNKLGALIYQATACFAKIGEQLGRRILAIQGGQLVTMALEKIKQDAGIGQVILGTGRSEGGAVANAGGGDDFMVSMDRATVVGGQTRGAGRIVRAVDGST